MASLSQGRTAAAQCGLFTHKSVLVIFEPPCIYDSTVTKFHVRQLLRFPAVELACYTEDYLASGLCVQPKLSKVKQFVGNRICFGFI